MSTLLKLVTCNFEKLEDATRALIILGKGIIPWGYEDNMRATGMIDKLETRYSIMGLDAKSRFLVSYEESSAMVHREAPNREKLLHLWLAYLIFKAAEKSRANKAKDDTRATLNLSDIEGKDFGCEVGVLVSLDRIWFGGFLLMVFVYLLGLDLVGGNGFVLGVVLECWVDCWAAGVWPFLWFLGP